MASGDASAGGRRPRKEPSWVKVYWTTFRLYAERRWGVRLHRRRTTIWGDEEDLPPARPLALAAFAGGVLGVLALATAGIVFLVSGTPAPPHPAAPETSAGPSAVASPSGTPGTGPSASAGAVPEASGAEGVAALWIVAQVGPDHPVACDPAMCALLRLNGFPAASLITVGTDISALGRAEVVAATPGLRAQLGPALAARVAAEPLAAFGSGDAAVSVEAVTTAAPTTAAVESAARRSTGGALLTDSQVDVVNDDARSLLAGGGVDPRVLTLVATLAASGPIEVQSFGAAAPGAGPDVLRRSVQLTTPGSTQTADLALAIDAQPPPDLPLSVADVAGPDGPGVLVTYSAPSPSGVDVATAPPPSP